MARITRMTKRRLGELLQAEGLVSEVQVRSALEVQRNENLFLSEALVKLGFISEEAIAHTIVQQFSLPFMSANQWNIGVDVLVIFPERMYYEYQFIAVDKMGSVLIICGASLMNHDVLDELERTSGCKVCQYVSTWKDIRSALEKYAKDMRKEEESTLSDLGNLLFDSNLTPPVVPLIKNPAPPPRMNVGIPAAPFPTSGVVSVNATGSASALGAVASSTKSSGRLSPVSMSPTPLPHVPGMTHFIQTPLSPNRAVSPTPPPMPTPISALTSSNPLNKATSSGSSRGPVTNTIPKSALSGPPSQRQVSKTFPPNPNSPTDPQQGQVPPLKDKEGPPPPKTSLLGLFKK